MEDRTLDHWLSKFRSGCDLPAEFCESFFDDLIKETDIDLLTRILKAWNQKGITSDELSSMASVMRSRMTRISTKHEIFVDAVGTGGSSAKTFNISTAAAFVIAGAGVPIAKHGNRAATSNSGSADVLSTLGVRVDVEPERARQCLDELGICFMFAPKFHSLSTPLASARRNLGAPTIFNSLGPLCNPAAAPHQLIGAWSRDLSRTMADVLSRLGTRRSWVVYGEDGLDEITLRGKTYVHEITGFQFKSFEIDAAEFGIAGGGAWIARSETPADSAGLIRGILQNGYDGHPHENIVLINAAASIYLAGAADTLPAAFQMAKDSVKSGRAASKLEALKTATNL